MSAKERQLTARCAMADAVFAMYRVCAPAFVALDAGGDFQPRRARAETRAPLRPVDDESQQTRRRVPLAVVLGR